MRHTMKCPHDVGEAIQAAGHAIDGPHFFLLSCESPNPENDGEAASVVCTDVTDYTDNVPALLEAISGMKGQAVMLAHTHETKDGQRPEPCGHDIEMTIGFMGLAILNGVSILDHCIIGHTGDVFSLAGPGILRLCLMQALTEMPEEMRDVTVGTWILESSDTLASRQLREQMMQHKPREKAPATPKAKLTPAMRRAIDAAKARAKGKADEGQAPQ